MDNTWRAKCSDGSFVEGVKHTNQHVHYDSSGGSDIPVSQKNQADNTNMNLRTTPLIDINKKF